MEKISIIISMNAIEDSSTPTCFIAGTPVLTERGYKNIEDVLLRDRLLTHAGRFQPLVNLQRKIYTGLVYTIHLSAVIITTEEHPFFVKKKTGSPEWKKAKDLTINDYFGMLKTHVNSTKNVAFVDDEYMWSSASSITKRWANNITVYNFEVVEDNSYVVANTIVHNCAI